MTTKKHLVQDGNSSRDHNISYKKIGQNKIRPIFVLIKYFYRLFYFGR